MLSYRIFPVLFFSALEKIIITGYRALHLMYFFTVGPDEVRAWTIQVCLPNMFSHVAEHEVLAWFQPCGFLSIVFRLFSSVYRMIPTFWFLFKLIDFCLFLLLTNVRIYSFQRSRQDNFKRLCRTRLDVLFYCRRGWGQSLDHTSMSISDLIYLINSILCKQDKFGFSKFAGIIIQNFSASPPKYCSILNS